MLEAGAASPPDVCYVSTASVCGRTADEPNGDVPDAFNAALATTAAHAKASNSGYVQSKFVSECRLMDAHRRGLCRLSIVRPGLIGPDTRSGSANLQDWLMRFVAGALIVGGFPAGASGAKTAAAAVAASSAPSRGTTAADELFRVTAVDHAASATRLLFEAVRRPVGDDGVHVWHLPLSISMSTAQFLDGVARASVAVLGRRMRVFGLSEWRRIISSLEPNNPLHPFRSGAVAQFGLKRVGGHRHARTSAALATTEFQAIAGASGGEYSDEMIRELMMFFKVKVDLLADAPLLQRCLSGMAAGT